MLLNILQCVGQPPQTTKNYPTQNVSSAEIEKPWSKCSKMKLCVPSKSCMRFGSVTLWTVGVTLVQRFQFIREDFPVTSCSASSDPASFTEITKDCDENKENKTPEGSQGEVDWLQQYDMEREREEQELQQALAQSLQEQVRDTSIAVFSLPVFPNNNN